MKKKLLTLGVAGLLAGVPNAHAKIKTDTSRNLAETVMTKKQNKAKEPSTISFEDVKKLQEQQKFIEEAMQNEKMKELVKIHGQEDVQEAMKIILNDKEYLKITEKILSDSKIQKALAEGNQEEVTKRAEEIIKNYRILKFTDKVSMLIRSIIFIIIGIKGFKELIESILGQKIIIAYGKKRK